MSFDQQVAQSLPCENVEPILSVLLNLDERHDKPSHRTRPWFPDDLTFAVERDVTELPDVAELPRCTPAGLDLDGDVSAGFVGRDDVVMRDVAGERGSDQPAARELRRDEVLTGLPDKLVAASCSHYLVVPQRPAQKSAGSLIQPAILADLQRPAPRPVGSNQQPAAHILPVLLGDGLFLHYHAADLVVVLD